jgi:hypothetical protein
MSLSNTVTSIHFISFMHPLTYNINANSIYAPGNPRALPHNPIHSFPARARRRFFQHVCPSDM